MINELGRYIDPVYTYRFTQGPDKAPDEISAQRHGLNCVALAHLAIRSLFGHSLPPELHCYEMFSDTTSFRTVDAIEDMQTGDLAWFGVNSPPISIDEYEPRYDENGALINWQDNPIKHVAVFTGERSDDRDHLMLHATHIAGTNVLWPLSQFTSYRRYERLYRISRLAIS